MKFSKTETDAKSKKANLSLYDSDDEDQARNFHGHAPSQVAQNPYGAASSMPAYAKAQSPKPVEIAPAPVLVNQGPVVLDKFGNFRRVVEPTAIPVQNPSDSRRSRSKRRSRSDSR